MFEESENDQRVLARLLGWFAVMVPAWQRYNVEVIIERMSCSDLHSNPYGVTCFLFIVTAQIFFEELHRRTPVYKRSFCSHCESGDGERWKRLYLNPISIGLLEEWGLYLIERHLWKPRQTGIIYQTPEDNNRTNKHRASHTSGVYNFTIQL